MPESVVVRALKPADADAYLSARLEQVELEATAFAESPDEVRARTVEMVAARLAVPSDEAFVLGAFADGRLIGTAGFFRRPESKTRHKGRVWGVFVSPAFRGQGFGRVLMHAVIVEVGKIAGLEQVDLAVAVTQPAARRLYESLGFSAYGREPHALKIGEAYVDEDLLVLRIPKP